MIEVRSPHKLKMTEDSEHSGTNGTEGGNTNSPSVGKHRAWMFTWNNYPEDWEATLVTKFMVAGVEYVMQPEIGEQLTPHIQGCIKFNNPRGIRFQRDFPIMHWEACRSWANACKYCSKMDTADGEVVTNLPLYERPKDFYLPEEAREWQRSLISLTRQVPDTRKIYWVWSEAGGVGKSTLARHLVITNADCIVVGGSARDVGYAVSCAVDAKGPNPRIVIWDLPRSHGVVDYEAIENVKNGLFFSAKYESKMVIYNPPHIIVFANVEPDKEKMSPDRWEVMRVEEQFVIE